MNVLWIPETDYRGIGDEEVVDLANSQGRVVLTRDSDFLKSNLRRRSTHGIIYIDERIRKDNIEKLASNVMRSLEYLREKRMVVMITASTIEILRLEE